MSNHRLWAPWRLEYIKGEKPTECIFCTKPGEETDEAALIVCRGKLAYVLLNAYPYNNGHLMVAPYEHAGSLELLDSEALLEVMALTQQAVRALDTAYRPEGYNVGFNQGKVAGAGMEHHLHLHVVPRWTADTNFMPVLGDTRVLPQRLADSYTAIRDSWPS